MRILTAAALAATISAGLLAPALLTAGPENQRTELTVHRAVEVPGATLQPGDYVIELAGATVSDSVVAIRDADSQELAAPLILTIPTRRDDIPGETKFTFYESPGSSPPALRSWFYPGDITGHQFVYPESRGKEIAKASGRYVPTASDADYGKAKVQGDDLEPALLAVHEITVYSLSPDSTKGSVEDGVKWNREADSKVWTPDRYVRAREMEESRVERQIRKEIVTLPFYSIWDHIEYRLDGDKVTLMGSVYRPSMKKSVERVVKNIEGISTVKNEIEIQPTSSQDDQIRRAAYRAIYGHPALQNYQLRAVPPIHIIVENGNITLEGVVQNSMDKNVAGVQANSVSGAFKVTNNLRTES